MWNVTGWDWKGKPAEYVERKVIQQIRGGDVILLHDGSHAGIRRGSFANRNCD